MKLTPGRLGSRFAYGKTPTQFSSTIIAEDGQSENSYDEKTYLSSLIANFTLKLKKYIMK